MSVVAGACDKEMGSHRSGTGEVHGVRPERVPGSVRHHQSLFRIPWEEIRESPRDEIEGMGRPQGLPVTSRHKALTDDVSRSEASVFMPGQPVGNLDR